MKSYFLSRVVAYLIDIILVSVVVSLISFPFLNHDNLDKLNEEAISLNEKYLNSEISEQVYLRQNSNIQYDIAYENVAYSIIFIGVNLLYFVVFQYYQNGQTIGKRLLRIKLVGNDKEELTINGLAYRSLIINSVLANLLLLIVTVFTNKSIYFYFSNGIQVVASVIMLVCIFMAMFRKDGRALHDLIGHTQVVKVKE